MNRNLAMQLAKWRQMVSGFAVAVFAMVFLASVTQANAQYYSDGQAIDGHLKHFVVASQQQALKVSASETLADDTSADGAEAFGALITALVLLQPACQATPKPSSGPHQPALAHYRLPQLRAPPTA